MKGRRGVIRGQGQQQLVDRRRKVAARSRGGDEAALAVDPDGDGHSATRLRGVTDVGDDRPMGESSRSALTFQPVRKPPPRIAARDVDRFAVWMAQPHEGKVELQHRYERIGEPGAHGRRALADPRRRDREPGGQVPQRRLQAEGVGVAIDLHVTAPEAGSTNRPFYAGGAAMRRPARSGRGRAAWLAASAATAAAGAGGIGRPRPAVTCRNISSQVAARLPALVIWWNTCIRLASWPSSWVRYSSPAPCSTPLTKHRWLSAV